LTWYFAGLACERSGYFKLSGIVAPRRRKASRWMLVGSVSIGTVAWAPVNRTAGQVAMLTESYGNFGLTHGRPRRG